MNVCVCVVYFCFCVCAVPSPKVAWSLRMSRAQGGAGSTGQWSSKLSWWSAASKTKFLWSRVVFPPTTQCLGGRRGECTGGWIKERRERERRSLYSTASLVSNCWCHERDGEMRDEGGVGPRLRGLSLRPGSRV